MTSRGTSWELGATTEPTNFEAQEESRRNGGGVVKPATKRINDKNLSEEDELVLLLTYFGNPNSVVFTESVLEGLLGMRDPTEKEGDQVAGTGSESSQGIGPKGQASGPTSEGASEHSVPQHTELDVKDQKQGEVNVSKPAGGSTEVADHPSTLQNETLSEDGDVANITTEVSKDTNGTSHQANSSSLPSPPPSDPPSASTASPSQPTTTSTPTSVISSASSLTAPSLFPDIHSRRPSPSSSVDSIHAEPNIGESSSPGIRTGAGVLTDIRTGTDILEDIADEDAAEKTEYHKEQSQDHLDWYWDDTQDSWGGDGQGSWSQDGQDSWKQDGQDSWTHGDDSWTHDENSWADTNHESWSAESIPPEVQYYRQPTTSSTGRPESAVDAFEWHDSPVPEWRPVTSPPPTPQAESLIARPPERSPQGHKRGPQGHKRDPQGHDGDGAISEDERVVVDFGEQLTATRKPSAEDITAVDLEFIEETVYTNAAYRPEGEAEVSQTAAMTTAAQSTTAAPMTTTAESMTSDVTTLDPYVM